MIALFVVLSVIACAVSADEGCENTCPLEKQNGFVQLFAGESELSPELWGGNIDGYPVENGVIVCRKGGKLMTKEKYADFIFRFEFRLPPKGNNGVGIRAPLDGDAAYEGMEIQILSDAYEGAQPWQKHGSIYGVVPAETGALLPDGEWNTEEIIAIGPRIIVTVNGKMIVNADISDAKPIHDNQHPGLHNKTGHIGFLGHGDPVEFRNIRVLGAEDD